MFDLRTPKGELNTKAKAIDYNGDGKLNLNQLKDFLEEYGLAEKYEDSKHFDGKYDADTIFEFIQSKKDYRQKFNEKFGNTMNRDELIAYIEQNNLEEEINARAEAKWEEFEESIKTNRKKKYSSQLRSEA